MDELLPVYFSYGLFPQMFHILLAFTASQQFTDGPEIHPGLRKQDKKGIFIQSSLFG